MAFAVESGAVFADALLLDDHKVPAKSTVGASSAGAARTIVRGLRGGVGMSACPVTSVAWRLGDDFNPLLVAKTGQLDAWARLWRTWSRDERIAVAKVWAQLTGDPTLWRVGILRVMPPGPP